MAFVLAPTNQMVLKYVDRGGKTSTVSYHVDNTETDPNAGGAGDLATKTDLCIDAAPLSREMKILAVNSAPAVATAGAFDRVMDKAHFEFFDTKGTKVVIQIPAPQSSILATNGFDVDPADPNVAAFLAALQAVAYSAEGFPISKMGKAYRRRPTRLKKQ